MSTPIISRGDAKDAEKGEGRNKKPQLIVGKIGQTLSDQSALYGL